MSEPTTHSYSYPKADIKRYTTTRRTISPSSSVAEFLSYADQEKRNDVWSKQYHKMNLHQCTEQSAQHAREFKDDEELLRYLKHLLVMNCNMNIPAVKAVEDKGDRVNIVYEAPKHSLHDVLTYSPAVFQDSLAKIQFVIYQLLQCQHFLHSNGTVMGTITLRDVYIDDNLWISVCPKFYHDFISTTQDSSIAGAAEESQEQTTHESTNQSKTQTDDVSVVTDKWVHGDISNFEYLMYINKCSGRVSGDPNHHPVLPWIMDFSQPLGGWRDLAQSKFRLNKGDAQLDQTYEVAQQILQSQQEEYDAAQTVFPHHISDVLSDITYYTYKARRTPKETLCQFVRQKWVPHEYPSSIRRLQEWTPDECIPEFFTDPSIFLSIHDDLADLEIPSWADSAEDFIEKHRCALESDYVSQSLHHWIDLTFGYKLSGQAAVDAKNVCLELIDGHTTYTDHGIVQLFTKPHPERVCVATKYISSKAPDILYKQRALSQPPPTSSTDNQESLTDSAEFDNLVKSMEGLMSEPIHLPPDFDPTQLLDRIEKDPKTRPVSKTCSCHHCPYHNDTLYLGCLLAKMILPMPTRLMPDYRSMPLDVYVRKVRSIVGKHRHTIPRALTQVLHTILEMRDPRQSRLTCNYLLPPVVPGLLLAPSVLPLPTYFHHLYELISYHLLTTALCDKSALSVGGRDTPADNTEVELRLKERINLHTQFVAEFGTVLQWEGLELYLPYVKELLVMEDGDHCVQASWYLFGQLSQILGKSLTRSHFSGLILDLFARDDISDVRKVKLFHKAFMHLLVMQLGVAHFVEQYSLPLAAAVCCSSLAAVHADTDLPGERASVSLEDGLDLSAVLVDCVIWLAARLGPLLTAKYFTSRILQTMKDCYNIPLAFSESSGQVDVKDDLTSKTVYGDVLLLPAIKCLEEIAFLYGEQYILLQYIPAIRRVVSSCDTNDLQASSPASLLSCCTLLLHLIPCITDGTLLDLLEIRVIGEVLLPLITIVSSPFYAFPSTSSPEDGTSCRKLLAFRILDLIILVSQRIGYDQTRRFLKRTLLAFFRSFDIVHCEDGTWCRYKEGKSGLDIENSSEYVDIKQSSINANEYYIGTPVTIYSTSPDSTASLGNLGNEVSRSNVPAYIMKELEEVFTAELAHRAYIQCCRLAGGYYIQKLANDDLIRRLCTEYELEMEQKCRRAGKSEENADSIFSDGSDDGQLLGDKRKSTNWFVPVPVGPGAAEEPVPGVPYESVSGNKLAYIPPVTDQKHVITDSSTLLADSASKYMAISAERLKRAEMETQTTRHLKGDWIAYWEHELGHGGDTKRPLNFKQIGLQGFTGHVGAVRSLHALENENSFISAGKDKTVKLWTLRNTGSGSSRLAAQLSYSEHKRPVFFATYLNAVKQIASCDGTIHVWDPITGTPLSQYEPSKTAGGVTAVQTLENPLSDHYIVAATTESTVRFIDVRSDRLAHEFRLSTIPTATLGYVPGIAVGPTWIAVAHSAGVITTLDIRTGFHLACWHCKGPEGELTKIMNYGSKELVTSSTDGQFGVWRYDASTPLCQIKLTNELQVCSMSVFDQSIITASHGNKISTHIPNIVEGKIHSELGDKLRADIFKGNLTAMDILPMNRQLILGADNGNIHLMA